ncbi:MAG: phosphoribosylformylglycinamidine synthase subunit PurS [Dehalococcoidia bacterium]|nr:phosphoribosylformylglycinamidine synthase subunit PurS [Dehalococcoidia bacterium]
MSEATRYLARVQVSLKSTVNDPEGTTIAGALGNLGFGGVESVRSGKYFQVVISAQNKEKAGKLVDDMCARLLANPVIETYSYEVEALAE